MASRIIKVIARMIGIIGNDGKCGYDAERDQRPPGNKIHTDVNARVKWALEKLHPERSSGPEKGESKLKKRKVTRSKESAICKRPQ